MIKVKIQDKNLAGILLSEMMCEIRKNHMTVEEIISLRIYQEIQLYRDKVDAKYQGLVQPEKTEVELNGYRDKAHQIDAKKQIQVALSAFQKNGYIMLVDDQQVESLDQVVRVHPEMQVCFIKLVPLVGG